MINSRTEIVHEPVARNRVARRFRGEEAAARSVMDNAGIVVIGASAGGVQALRTLVSGLPADFAGAALITLHVSPSSPRLLPEILRGAGPLPVRYAADGDAIEPGHIYVAPPDRHMLIEATGRLVLSRGPKSRRCRRVRCGSSMSIIVCRSPKSRPCCRVS